MSIQHDTIRLVGNGLLCLVLFGLILAADAVQADIYFWQDADGVIHFSNQNAPPLSQLYARETQALEPVTVAPADQDRASLTEAQERQKELQDRLEASLAKVAQLTRQVEAAQEEAQDTTVAAQQALAKANSNAAKPVYSQPPVRERIVYYAVPHFDKRPAHRKKRPSHFKPVPGRYSTVHRKAKVRQQLKLHTGRQQHLKRRDLGNARDGNYPRRSSTYRGPRHIRN